MAPYTDNEEKKLKAVLVLASSFSVFKARIALSCSRV